MAKEVVFKLKVVDETGNVIQKTINNVNELKRAQKELSEQLERAPIGSAKFNELKGNLEKVEGALKKAKTQKDGFVGSLSKAPGIIGTVTQSIQGMGVALRALLANPVVLVVTAIVGVFGTLFNALKKTEAGVFALNRIMATFTGLIQPLVNLIQKLAINLAEGLANALEKITRLFAAGGSQAALYANEANKLADALNRVEEAESDLAVKRSEVDKQLAEARAKLADDNLTLEERREALEQVRIAETELAQKEVDIAKERARIMNQQFKMDQENKEKKQAAEQATIALNKAEQANAQTKRTLQRETNRLNSEEKRSREERLKQLEAERKERDRIEQEQLAAYIKFLDDEFYFNEKQRIALLKSEKEKQEQLAKLESTMENMRIARLKEREDAKNLLILENGVKLREQLKAINDKYAAQEREDRMEIMRATATDLTNQREIELIETEQYYKELRKKAKESELPALAKAEAAAIAEIKRKHREDDLRDELDYLNALNTNSVSYFEFRIRATEVFYDNLIAVEEAGSARQIALEKAKNKQLELINNEYFSAIALAYMNVLAGVAAFAAEIAGEDKKKQKIAIKLESAAAVGSIAINSQKNAAKAGYLTPIGIAELIAGAAGIATVIAQAANAIKNLDAVNTTTNTPSNRLGPSKFEKGGVLRGPSHAQGGILTPFGELEGGEFVVNKFATQSFLPMLEAINQNGQTGMDKEAPVTTGMTMPIVKTYVLASEVSSQQEAQKRISDLARL
jgi:hypothetical protein